MMKIHDKWRDLLEEDLEVIYPRNWIGFYYNGVDDLAFVVQCGKDFNPLESNNTTIPCLLQLNVSKWLLS